jgi:RNA polymerase sigma factor (sigma-70 family)
MANSGSVSQWIKRLKRGESVAATHVWDRYHDNLLRLARRRLNGATRRVADEEDVVCTAFQSFFRRARDGQFPELAGRDELWALLSTITHRKAVNVLRVEQSKKRGGGKVWSEWHSLVESGDDSHGLAATIVAEELAPERAAAIAELLGQLDPDLRQIVMLRLEGKTHEEISRRVNRSLATVERRLSLLRDKWEQELLS